MCNEQLISTFLKQSSSVSKRIVSVHFADSTLDLGLYHDLFYGLLILQNRKMEHHGSQIPDHSLSRRVSEQYDADNGIIGEFKQQRQYVLHACWDQGYYLMHLGTSQEMLLIRRNGSACCLRLKLLPQQRLLAFELLSLVQIESLNCYQYIYKYI